MAPKICVIEKIFLKVRHLYVVPKKLPLLGGATSFIVEGFRVHHTCCRVLHVCIVRIFSLPFIVQRQQISF